MQVCPYLVMIGNVLDGTGLITQHCLNCIPAFKVSAKMGFFFLASIIWFISPVFLFEVATFLLLFLPPFHSPSTCSQRIFLLSQFPRNSAPVVSVSPSQCFIKWIINVILVFCAVSRRALICEERRRLAAVSHMTSEAEEGRGGGDGDGTLPPVRWFTHTVVC